MARRIADQEMRGSVARLLDPAVATAALAPAEMPFQVQFPERSTDATRVCTRRYIKREFILSPETDGTLIEVLSVLYQSTGRRLNASQVIRSMLLAVRPALPLIRNAATQMEAVARPVNRRGQHQARTDLERYLARLIGAGLRGAAGFQADADESLRVGTDPAGAGERGAVLRPSSSRPGG